MPNPKADPHAEFAPDGTRLFNPNKPHGTVYADGFNEAKWFQDGVLYRADRFPVGYVEKSETPDPAPKDKPVHWTQRKKLEEAQRAAASGAS